MTASSTCSGRKGWPPCPGRSRCVCWETNMPDDTKGREDGHVHLAFGSDLLTVPVTSIVLLKTLPEGARASRSYAQVLSSIRAIGLIEAPVVMADPKKQGDWFLLDGHLRLEALKELDISEVECLLAAEIGRAHV